MYTANLNDLKNLTNQHNKNLLFCTIGTILCLKKLIGNMYDSIQCAQCLHAEHTRPKKRHLCPVFNSFWIFHNTDNGEQKDLNRPHKIC